MNVLVTGSNGFLGHHVVMELLKRQHHANLIVRNKQKISFDLGSVTLFEGNFTDYTDLRQAASGCDAIIHIAADTATNLLHLEDYQTINVTGTAQVIQVAKELNIRNIVYISSSNTVGYGAEQLPGDERLAIQYPFTTSFYAQSKAESEELMKEASKEPGQHVVIINPSFMIGSNDSKPGSGKLILMGYKRRLMFTPKGGKNFVPVSNVAVVACNAITMGRNGERYLASGINLTFKEFYSLQKQEGNYKQLIIGIPDFLLLIVGILGDLIRKSGIKTDLCTMNLRQLMIRENYNNQKAKTELDLPESDIPVAVKEAIDWFKEHNMV
jgi:nucleoside-diphosphate-sugar epimerase